MFLIATIIWRVLICLTTVTSEPQCGYPCVVPIIPMPPPPQPVGIPIPVAVPIPVRETTTTCTTEKGKGTDLLINNLIYPIPPWPFTNKNFTMKFPPQMQQLSYPVPPPMPVPFPMPAAPPVIMIPFPPVRILKKRKPIPVSNDSDSSSSDNSSSDSDSDTSSSSDGRKKKHYGIYRRSRRNDIGEVKPMLTYLSEDGQVIFRRHLTKRDEELLMNDNESMQKVEILTGEDMNGKSKVLVVAKPARRAVQSKKTNWKQHTLEDGKKEIVFRPPSDKKITNLSVTFNMEK